MLRIITFLLHTSLSVLLYFQDDWAEPDTFLLLNTGGVIIPADALTLPESREPDRTMDILISSFVLTVSALIIWMSDQDYRSAFNLLLVTLAEGIMTTYWTITQFNMRYVSVCTYEEDEGGYWYMYLNIFILEPITSVLLPLEYDLKSGDIFDCVHIDDEGWIVNTMPRVRSYDIVKISLTVCIPILIIFITDLAIVSHLYRRWHATQTAL